MTEYQTKLVSDPHVAMLDDIAVDEYEKIERALQEAQEEAAQKICEKLLDSATTSPAASANKPGRAVVQELVDHAEFLSPDDFTTKPEYTLNLDGCAEAEGLRNLSKSIYGRTDGGSFNGLQVDWISFDEYGEIVDAAWQNVKTDNSDHYSTIGQVITKKTIVSGS